VVSPGLFNARERGLSFHILPDGIVEDTGGEKPHARVKAEQRKKKPFSQALFFVSLLAIDVNIANVDTQLLAFLLGRTLCRAQCVSPPSRWRRGGPDYQATIRGYNRGGGRTSEVADATTCPALGPTDDASITLLAL
jgi:hypothetical protein